MHYNYARLGPPGQDARFFKVPGTQYTGGGSGVTVTGVTEDQCINQCASNQVY